MTYIMLINVKITSIQIMRIYPIDTYVRLKNNENLSRVLRPCRGWGWGSHSNAPPVAN